MRSIALRISLLALQSILLVKAGVCQEQTDTPARQYDALRKEYDRVSSSGVALTDAERLEFIGRVYRHRSAIAEKLLQLAEKHPRDAIAFDALVQSVWQVNTTPWPVELVGQDAARSRAFQIIERDHIQSEKLGPLCQRVSYGFCQEYETFLRAVILKNPHSQVQANARLSLARFLYNRMHRVDLCKELPELADEFAGLYGKEYLDGLRREDRDAVVREIESVYEMAVAKFGDERLPGGTVAELAKMELAHFRNLRVGKEAPDIEGEDQDGRQFKLTDYRGKVVLLDFWSYV
jgi:hypothetical protein